MSDKRITTRRNPTYQRHCYQILERLAKGNRHSRSISTILGIPLERTIRILRDLRWSRLAASSEIRLGKQKPIMIWLITPSGRQKLAQLQQDNPTPPEAA